MLNANGEEEASMVENYVHFTKIIKLWELPADVTGGKPIAAWSQCVSGEIKLIVK
jgi:hypothetical protein